MVKSTHVRFGTNGSQSVAVQDDDMLLVVPAQLDGFWFEPLADFQREAVIFLRENGSKACADGCSSSVYSEEDAKAILDRACAEYEAMQERSRSSDASILKNLLKKGTNTDQVAAVAVAIEAAPVHLAPFGMDRLLNIASKKSIEHSWTALEALRDVFGGCLLPDTRRLRAWDSEMAAKVRPALSRRSYEQWALYRSFEALLKRQYAEFISVIELACRSDVEWFRMKALTLAQQMLSMKPEAEARLLSLLVNKIGDPSRKVSGRAQSLVLSLAEEHPNMKKVIVDELDRLVMRANISPRAQYAGVLVLTQTRFSHEDSALAERLIALYMMIFRSHRGPKKGKRKKTTGTATTSRLLPVLLTGLNRAFPYASDDVDLDEHLDMLFGLARCQTSFTTVIQSLTLLFQIVVARQSLSARFYRSLYESLLSPLMPTSSKVHMYLNLLFRSMKSDNSVARVAAFSKRLLQVALRSSPALLCGCLYLVSELTKTHPSLRMMIDSAAVDGEDDVEVFQDHDEDDSDAGNQKDGTNSDAPKILYDAAKRDPEFANANTTCFWEFSLLRKHFHPSVVKFVSMIVDTNEGVSYEGDPIRDFTNMAFLDRFVYRNPKKVVDGVHAPRRRTVSKPLNCSAFWRKDISEVREDERFFHTYFRLVEASGTKTLVDRKEGKEDGSVDDGEEDFAMRLFERELMKDGAGPVDIDDDDIDFEKEFGTIHEDSAEEAVDEIDNDQLGAVFDDEDLDDDDMDDMIVQDDEDDYGEDGDEEEEEVQEGNGKKSKPKSRFVDAEEYAELLDLTNEAAAALQKTEQWQNKKSKSRGHKRRSKGQRGQASKQQRT